MRGRWSFGSALSADCKRSSKSDRVCARLFQFIAAEALFIFGVFGLLLSSCPDRKRA